MATKMNVSGHYGTHLPCLIKAMEKTTGDVLELGMGIFSTPYLHYQCLLSDRKLVSYENYPSWANFFIKYGYSCPNHEIIIIDDYAKAKIDKPWDVVLIDQTPDSSRAIEIRRLTELAKYIIIHDANPEKDKIYHYSEIYPLFKYKTVWNKDDRKAAVLSNLVSLEDFWK
jgi:hypothetical protein